MTLAELMQQRAKVASEMRSQHEAAGEAAWTDEQRSAWDSRKAELKRLDAQIEREEDLRSNDQRYVQDNATDLANKARKTAVTGTEDEQRAAAFDKFVRHGLAELNADEKRALDEMRAMAAGVGDKGGYTVPTTFIARVHESLVSYGGIAGVAQILVTETGNPIEWPTSNGAEEEGELLGENQQASELDVTFDMATLGGHKISSKIIRVSNELLNDSGINMEAFLAGRIASRIGRTESRLIVKGTGAGNPLQPKGLEASAAVGATTSAAATFKWQDINALIHSIDPAYRNSPKFRIAFNDLTLQALEEMVDGQQRPLWIPGIDSARPPTVLAKQYVIDPAIDPVGAGKKFAFAGDFNELIIRRVRYMALKRLVERYAEFDQTAFLAFHRFGVVLQDTAAIKALQGKPA